MESNPIRDAIAVLKSGGVIAYPTETLYGLGCDPRDAKAVRKIFRLKGRDDKKPVLLVASSLAQVRKVAVVRGKALELAKRFWPGPLTLVLPVRTEQRQTRRGTACRAPTGLARPIGGRIAPKGEVAIRVTSSKIASALARGFGLPVVSTSANRSGEPPCRSGSDVMRVFGSIPVLDAGALPNRKPSTVAKVRPDGSVEILRQGAIKVPPSRSR